MEDTAEARFMAKVAERASGCLEWTACLDKKGYGRFGVSRGRLVFAHRFAWELFVGPIPPETPKVLHHCDNPRCVRANPDPLVSHLFLGTQADNVHDMMDKGRGLVVTAPCGTISAYNRHLRHKEPPCDLCRAAARAYWKVNNAGRARRAGRDPAQRWSKPCGTPAAYRRHKRNGEEPCAECREATRAHDRERWPNRRRT